MTVIHRELLLPVSAKALFDWHTRPGNTRSALPLLTPPNEKVSLEDVQGPISEDGSRVSLRIHVLGPIFLPWVLEHQNFKPGESFEDRQVQGPFAFWRHTHLIQPVTDHSCRLIDQVEYRLPFDSIIQPFLGWYFERKLKKLFDYRHQVMRQMVSLLKDSVRVQPMTILVTGASGLVGQPLVATLRSLGHAVIELSRQAPSNSNQLQWDPKTGNVSDLNALGSLDAVIHLAGENIAAGRWNDERKQAIHDSRVIGTQSLLKLIASLPVQPKTFISASAIGFYGDKGETTLDEKSPAGNDFLAKTCAAWEDASKPLDAQGIRRVLMRFGIVLSPQGGALAKILPPFQLGGGGTLGFTGNQYMSWIAIDDVIGSIVHALNHDDVKGSVNVVAPSPETNKAFTKILGRVLKRPTFVPAPEFALRLLLGEMADALLLGSTKVLPNKLEATGYTFQYPDLEGALRHVLNKSV